MMEARNMLTRQRSHGKDKRKTCTEIALSKKYLFLKMKRILYNIKFLSYFITHSPYFKGTNFRGICYRNLGSNS